MAITTAAQKRIVAEALRRYLDDHPHADGLLVATVELMLLSAAARRAALLPYVQSVKAERTAAQVTLPDLRAAEDVRVAAAIADADDVLTNL